LKPSDTETRGHGDTGKELFSPRRRVSASSRPVYPVIKIVAACLLLISFFLPMSSCSYTVPIDVVPGETYSDGSKIPTETRTVINYAREYLDMSEIGAWLNILAFIWPILLIGVQWRFSGRKYSYLLTGSGILLSVFSAVVVYTWADIGTPLIGAYVGGGAVVVLFVSYVWELIHFFRQGESARRTQHAERSTQEKIKSFEI